MSAISGPVPPYSNPPIEPQYFQPSRFVISNITLGITTTITMIGNTNYVIGQECRLIIPSVFGSYQLNELTGLVIAIPTASQVVLNINSSNANTFIASPVYAPTPCQIIAIGDVSSGQINGNARISNNIYIPGSFQNISPN